MRSLGIDEAGRGCVLGDLFVAAFFDDGVGAEALKAAGAGDSKAMSAARRDRVRSALEGLGTWHLRRIPATAIDGGNLNQLEEDAIASLIREVRPDQVVIDALGSPASLGAALRRLRSAISPLTPEIVWVPKADRDHPVVGAASIFAKTERDRALVELASHWGDLGSGYPSDPVTKAWLRRRAAQAEPSPPFVRTRWGTIRDLSAELPFPGSL